MHPASYGSLMPHRFYLLGEVGKKYRYHTKAKRFCWPTPHKIRWTTSHNRQRPPTNNQQLSKVVPCKLFAATRSHPQYLNTMPCKLKNKGFKNTEKSRITSFCVIERASGFGSQAGQTVKCRWEDQGQLKNDQYAFC